MGWCSGTYIFDRVAAFVIVHDEISDAAKFNILYALADEMEDHDWDCQSDSDHYDHPIVQRVMKALHPDWFEGD